MYALRDNGILWEIECGNNFGYILENNSNLVNTDYKILQSQTSGIFVPCMKMLYNGKTELYYVTDDYHPMSSMLNGIVADTLITILVNLFANVIEVRNNGFLSCQNIDLSWDKIYVDANTLKVKLVYIPINIKIFDNYSAFESELRSSAIKVINEVIVSSNSRIEQFVSYLYNGSMTLEDVYNKSRRIGTQAILNTDTQDPITGNELRIVAMNAPEYFEIILNRDELLIGKKAELVDAVIPFNKMISRKHCKITKSAGAYYITDEGSANGTYINRIRIAPNQPKQINKGDIIRLADSDFQIV